MHKPVGMKTTSPTKGWPSGTPAFPLGIPGPAVRDGYSLAAIYARRWLRVARRQRTDSGGEFLLAEAPLGRKYSHTGASRDSAALAKRVPRLGRDFTSLARVEDEDRANARRATTGNAHAPGLSTRGKCPRYTKSCAGLVDISRPADDADVGGFRCYALWMGNRAIRPGRRPAPRERCVAA
jgi:hypothetical protein